MFYEQYPLLIIKLTPDIVANFISLRYPTNPAHTVYMKFSRSPNSSIVSANYPTSLIASSLAPLFCYLKDNNI